MGSWFRRLVSLMRSLLTQRDWVFNGEHRGWEGRHFGRLMCDVLKPEGYGFLNQNICDFRHHQKCTHISLAHLPCGRFHKLILSMTVGEVAILATDFMLLYPRRVIPSAGLPQQHSLLICDWPVLFGSVTKKLEWRFRIQTLRIACFLYIYS